MNVYVDERLVSNEPANLMQVRNAFQGRKRFITLEPPVCGGYGIGSAPIAILYLTKELHEFIEKHQVRTFSFCLEGEEGFTYVI